MSTVYVFHSELPEADGLDTADRVLLWDTSAGRMKYATLANVYAQIGRSAAVGASAADTMSFYGATPINQGTMTEAAVTALATATMSAGNAAGVWAFASSTAAQAFVTRMKQAQTDLDTLIDKLDTVGLLSET